MKQLSQSLVHGVIAQLVRNGAIAAESAATVQKTYAQDFDGLLEYLLAEAIVTRRDILVALSAYYETPWFDVTGYFFDHQLVHMFPKGFLLRHCIIPLMIDEDELIVVAADPSDPELLSDIGSYVSYDLQFNVGIHRHIEDAVKEFYDKALTSDIPDDSDLRVERLLNKEESEIEEAELEKLREPEE